MEWIIVAIELHDKVLSSRKRRWVGLPAAEVGQRFLRLPRREASAHSSGVLATLRLHPAEGSRIPFEIALCVDPGHAHLFPDDRRCRGTGRGRAGRRCLRSA